MNMENRGAELDGSAERPQVRGRRQFIQGQDLLRWWQDWGRTALLAPVTATRPSPATAIGGGVEWQPTGFYSHLTKRAMACEWEVFLNYGQYPNGAEQGLSALEQLEPWEAQLSVFRPESEISRVNRLAYEQAVAVSPELYQLLDAAGNLWALTEGAFDITSHSLSACWGFLKREGRMPNDLEIAEAMEGVGWDKVELDPQQRTVRFADPRLGINLGGIGKGWTLDQLAHGLVQAGIGDFIIHGGQSSVVARGQDARYMSGAAGPSEPSLVRGWPVGVHHPVYPDRQLGTLELKGRAMGTSGSARQFVHYRGRRLSHILDPRTGRPAEGVWSATVLAPTAAQADALGTACFVLGEEGCRRLTEQCPDLGILLIVPDGARYRMVMLGDVESHWSDKET